MYDTGMALLFLVESRWEELTSSLGQAESNPSEVSIHELRISCRRFLASLDLLKGVVQEECRSPLRQEVKKVLKLMGGTRDFQVALMELTGKKKTSGKVKSHLQKMEKQKRQALPSFLEKIDLETLSTLFANMWHKLSQSELLANDQAMKKAISDNVKALAQKSTAKVEKMKVSKSRSFHQARKFLRDLRYSLEGLDGAIPEIHGEEIKRLHRQQDYLGRVQDLEVIADVLRDLRDGLSPKEKAEVKKICKRLSKEQSKLQKKGKKRSQKDLGWLKELGEA